MSWAGVERMLVDWLTTDLGHRVCTELPADLGSVLPLIHVVRVGGPHHASTPYFQMPTINVDSFAADRGAATDLAEAVDVSLRRRLPGSTVLGARVGRTATITGPGFRAWDDSTLRRMGASYQLWLKAPTS